MNDSNNNDRQNNGDESRDRVTTTETTTTETTPSDNTDTEERKFPLWVSLLALFGILIVVAIAAIGIVRFAGNAENNLSRLGSGIVDIFRGGERIELDVEDPTVTSGDTVTIDINHRNKEAEGGTYSVVVECEENVTATVNGDEVTCDEELTLEGEPENVEVTLTAAEEERFIDVPVTIFYRNEDTELSREEILTIVNGEEDDEENGDTEPEDDDEPDTTDDTDEDVTETDDTQDSTPAYQTPQPQGQPDLAVAILAVGRIDNDGDFVEDDNLSRRNRAAVRFVVTNAGSAPTGPWKFNAILPVDGSEIYDSETQTTLYPSDRIEFTLGFDNIDDDDGADLYLSVDPLNRIDEISELNNFANIEFQL